MADSPTRRSLKTRTTQPILAPIISSSYNVVNTFM